MAPKVLISGASEGIGKATALLFASKGYDLVLAARNADLLATVADEIKTFDREALAVPTDVRDFEQVNALVRKALDSYGSIDVLVNNAGIFCSGPVENFSLSDWHQVVDTNFWGYVHTINALLPHFIERKAGTIVNVGSIGGKVPTPYLTPYCASKAAVAAMTEAMRSELKPKGIHVCAVHPNLIKSQLLERAIFRGKDEREAIERRQQLENVLKAPVIEKPQDVAKAIWDAVENKRSEVMVGSANMSLGAYRLFPGLMQWISRKTLQNNN